jgi:putative ABC transport system ATP-binding protein
MITLTQICKTYAMGGETIKALDHVDLNIHKGDYISVMGTSGSGKSTLLNVIGLLDRPDSGQYFLQQKNVASLDDDTQAQIRRETIGFVFQTFHLIPRLTAFENIELPLILDKIPATERRSKVIKALKQMGLERYQSHRPNEMSGGQMQRVAIARAIVNEPNILLCDEPTGNLDSHSSADVIAVLEALNQQGITLLVVTHDAKLGKRATRSLWMDDGQILKDETQSGALISAHP